MYLCHYKSSLSCATPHSHWYRGNILGLTAGILTTITFYSGDDGANWGEFDFFVDGLQFLGGGGDFLSTLGAIFDLGDDCLVGMRM